jgi:peptide/nickel transport system permease protein
LSIAFLGALHAVALLAGFLAPYAPEAQNRDFPFAPPTRLRLIDSAGRFHFCPFVYGLQSGPAAGSEYEEDVSAAYPVRFFIKERGDSRLRLFGVERPGTLFLLGTDGLGRDQFSRLLHGARISLFSGLIAAGLALGLALILGALAGFYGRWLDDGIMRGAELLLALPWLYCLLALRAFLPLHVTPGQTFLFVIAVIAARGWARPARLIRGMVLSAKERDYVVAARGFGASGAYLLRRHVLPQTGGVVLTQAAVLIPQYILAEVTLSFLGLGVSEPAPTWGNMLSALQQYHILVSYWWMRAPAIILIPVFLSYYALANALQRRYGESGAG